MKTVAVAGLGGFAGEHHAALLGLEKEGICRVVATCDPDPTTVATGRESFHLQERGVDVFESLEALLDVQKPDLVTLPTPIPLHAAQHKAVVESGAACYLEKPPTLWWPEFQSMLETDKRSERPTRVGFNFVGDSFRQSIKARMIAGEFGALGEVHLVAYWPRRTEYYARNGWAGRIRANGQWVLDSCIGNATAHYVQNVLFWCGTDVEAVGEIHELRAWLGRTHEIESFDTALIEAKVGNAILRLGVTHAETDAHFERETLTFERATIVFDRWHRARIEWQDGRIETVESAIPDQGALLRHNLATYLAGESNNVTSLEGATSFVALCDLALISSGAIHKLQASPHLEAFVTGGVWPDGLPTQVALIDLARLEETASTIASN